ncbi:hypothetical protein KFK14_20250 [Sphingobium phenoxybenzoativorans]|uniref:Uncharacterized protein n=1 Tax=Sphingobium phenoxybenzoativorans TaxID=1592790 RepID=A0A975K6K6_9SPHN|nr:hypothetical protein [Sphingobium phenoxybenzoativorans]QUT05299.1 hypothetical protein KFK14_20250 [Sphingobium phenoxybenzoativorans]
MLRTIIAGALIGFAGKKLYESGALKGFTDDLKSRLSDAHIANNPATAPAPAPAPVPNRAPPTAPTV